jgi:outer membrane lipoprotein LolB
MLRGIAPLWLALALGGCATTAPPTVVDAHWPANWALQGRIGIQADEQSLSGSFYWQHSGQSDELLLTSPLGQGVGRIVVNPDGARLVMPNQTEHRAANVETLTREVLGYAVPLAGLVWWVQAQAAPERIAETRRDASGRLTHLKQDGWVIDYQYATEMPARPRKLVVTRDGLEIRLLADSWKIE